MCALLPEQCVKQRCRGNLGEDVDTPRRHGAQTLSARHVTRYLVTGLLGGLCLFGCSKGEPLREGANESGYETLELRYQGNNGTVAPIELAEDLGYLEPIRLKFMGSTVSGPQSVQAVVTGDTDFGGAFNGAVIKLIAARVPIQAVVGYYGVDEKRWGGFYVLEDSPIKGAPDLLGKKVAMNTLGAHSELMLKEYLFRNQLTPDQARQVTLVVIPPVSSEQVLRQRQVDVAVLQDIYRDRALEKGGLRWLFSDIELFGKFTAGSYVMKSDFIAKNPKTSRKFVEAVARALEWARETPRERVLARFVEIVEKRSRNEDAAALPYWRSYGVAGKGGTLSEKDFQVWIDWMVKDGELEAGQLAPHQVFTNELNPYGQGTTAVR
jgi:ABC-type nitrate/sulfonate/bicarbonate transport system substrate-binding protein